MKKIIFAIFAHPDDEAFGPSGTLLLETKSGTELHIISLTAGENGMNPDGHPNLGEIRLEEWRAAGKLIGAHEMYHLGLTDGMLGNIAFLKVVDEVEAIVRRVIASQTEAVKIEFMSNDLNGISGHIDHIVAARAACFVFYKLKEAGLPLDQIRLATIPRSILPNYNLGFVYMEPGRPDDEIDETIDARSEIETVYKIMRAHHTQRSDGENHIKNRGDAVAINYFIVLK